MAGVEAQMDYYTYEKEVRITWGYDGRAYGNTPPSTQGASAQLPLVISTPYWPTVSIRLDEATVAIGGKLRRGGTVIELVEVIPPTPLYDPQSGAYSLETGLVGGRNYIYNEATAGRDMIMHLQKTLHDPSVLLVRFWDSKDMYLIDTNTETIQLVASSQATTNALYIPALDAFYPNAWKGDHLILGYVYVFYNGYDINGSLPTVLMDSDRNGSIESYVVPDQVAWTALGLGDANQFADW